MDEDQCCICHESLQNGKQVFVEVKTPTGVQSAAQKDFQSTVKNLGFKYHLVRSLQDFKNILDQLDLIIKNK